MSDWISAWDALKQSRTANPAADTSGDSSEDDKQRLLGALADGKIRACARFLIQEAENGLAPNFHYRKAKEVRLVPHDGCDESEFAIFDAVVPQDFFSAHDGWKLERSLWEVGNFQATKQLQVSDSSTDDTKLNNVSRRYLAGLEFNAEDIEQWIAAKEPALSVVPQTTESGPNERGKGGRPPRLSHWHDFWLIVLDLSEQNHLNKDSFETQADLRDAILFKMKKKLAEDTIKPVVQKIWYKYIELPAS